MRAARTAIWPMEGIRDACHHVPPRLSGLLRDEAVAELASGSKLRWIVFRPE
jgi:hypothetical protein